MIATHTIKRNGVLYKAGQEIPELIESSDTVIEKNIISANPKRTRSKKNKTVNEE